MMTFKQFAGKLETIPASTSWYLADLGEARGRQELYTRQAPQKLKILREHALIESAVSSNRIEGVTVDPSRIKVGAGLVPALTNKGTHERCPYRRRKTGTHKGRPYQIRNIIGRSRRCAPTQMRQTDHYP
jgi:hypothetical protein